MGGKLPGEKTGGEHRGGNFRGGKFRSPVSISFLGTEPGTKLVGVDEGLMVLYHQVQQKPQIRFIAQQ